MQYPQQSPEPTRGAHPSGHRAEAHPLLRPFPLAVMALALVAVLFALMMAQLNSATDPDLSASATGPHIAGVIATAEPRPRG